MAEPEPGDYAEVDDHDVVTIYRADGTPVVWMSLRAYRALRRLREKETEQKGKQT